MSGKKSTLQDLQALYGAAPSSSNSDFLEPTKKKKKVAVKKVEGFKINDYDALTRVQSAAKKDEDEEDEEDKATMEVDAELEERLAHERRIKRAREDGSGWVSLDKKPTQQDDLSPPRKRARTDESGDLSPPRRGGNTDADLSPPRRGHVDADLSPPRRGHVDRDLSPPRRGAASTDVDLSPPRRAPSHRDLSPPRRGANKDSDLSPPRRSHVESSSGVSTSASTGSMIAGQRAGLFSADEIVAENAAYLKQQMDDVKKLRPDEAGKSAATVYRDKKGRPLAMLNQIMNADKKDFKDETADMEWGVGKVDRAAKEQQMQEDAAEKERGYHGTTIHDERYNERMRDRMRWDDPMAKHVEKKAKTTKKLYQGYCPPNRFNIRPGHRWDGVDRSNGFEASMYQKTNEAMAKADRQLMWATADM